jgi:hypothetical protein
VGEGYNSGTEASNHETVGPTPAHTVTATAVVLVVVAGGLEARDRVSPGVWTAVAQRLREFATPHTRLWPMAPRSS